jgi:DNA invertase Pin-like site-specific DNA recombinase
LKKKGFKEERVAKVGADDLDKSTTLESNKSLERNLIKERTIAGLEAARARGRLGGRPKLNTSEGKVAMARKLYADKTYPIEDICKTLNISRATLYRYISGAGELTASRSRN